MIEDFRILQCDRCGSIAKVNRPADEGEAYSFPTGWQVVLNLILCSRHKLWVEVRIKDDDKPTERIQGPIKEIADVLAATQLEGMVMTNVGPGDFVGAFQRSRPFIADTTFLRKDFIDHLARIRGEMLKLNIVAPVKKLKGKKPVRKIDLPKQDEEEIPW